MSNPRTGHCIGGYQVTCMAPRRVYKNAREEGRGREVSSLCEPHDHLKEQLAHRVRVETGTRINMMPVVRVMIDMRMA